MVDTLVENLVDADIDQTNAAWGPYWIDINTAVIVFTDDTRDLSFARTTMVYKMSLSSSASGNTNAHDELDTA